MNNDFSKKKVDYEINIKNTYTEPLTEEYLIQVCKKTVYFNTRRITSTS